MESTGGFSLRQNKRPRDDDNGVSIGFSKRSREEDETPNNECARRRRRLPREHYTIGWICALSVEMAAANGMLDEVHESLDRVENDTNTYVLGNIGKHNIAIACLPINGYGTNNAATVAGNMRRSFSSIQAFLMVGIAGGVPGSADIRLGDVVIGTEVIPYDIGKMGAGGVFQSTMTLNKPPTSLTTAVSVLRAHHQTRKTEIPNHIREMVHKYPQMSKFSCPSQVKDTLFNNTYDGDKASHKDANCNSCDDNELVVRSSRLDTVPRIHYGRIASGNQVMKHGATRDRLSEEHNVLCFEMEAAGLMDGFPCLPIRGVCDYSDSHKNKRYQEYAAAAAAAYAKELLAVLSPYQVDLNIESEPPSDFSFEIRRDRRNKLLDALKYQQLNTRHDTIKAAHLRTCKWFVEQPEYKSWRDPSQRTDHHGFLWITGKPGAGKSTIMKFLFANEKKSKLKNGAVIAFFFNRRGDALEWSVAGMYRSLIIQLLQRNSDMQRILDDPRYDNWVEDSTANWDIEILRDLFSAAIDELGTRSLTCFIDALDECDQEDIWNMVDHIEMLGEQAIEKEINLHICFASRHYPHIDVKRRIKLTLEDQPGHKKDLEIYIQSKLRADGELADEIKATILDKSDSVFMWVVLVIDILNEEFRNGRMFAMKKRLQELPPRLSDLFRDILKRDNKNMKDLMLCIQWILYAQRPLSCTEFYLAVVSGVDPTAENLSQWDKQRITADDVKRFIQSSSKGVAESTKSNEPTVQFIHESVRDFLIAENGIHELWPEHSQDFESYSHEQLKTCCYDYMKLSITNGLLSDQQDSNIPSHERRKQRSTVSDGFPLLEYATKNILFHAEEAAKTLPQGEFLANFDASTWVKLHQASSTVRETRDSLPITVLYELAQHGRTRLLKTKLTQDPKINGRGGPHRYPLFAAIAHGQQSAVAELLRSLTNIDEAETISKSLKYGDDFTSNKFTTPLHWAAAKGEVQLVELLLNSNEFSYDMVDLRGRDPLKIASESHHYDAMFALLEFKRKKSIDHRGLLHWAIWDDNPGFASFLLAEKDVDVNESNDFGTPLIYAIETGNIEIAFMLLRLDNTDINQRDEQGRTAISYAARNEKLSIIQLLLDRKDVDLNSPDNEGITPLMEIVRCDAFDTVFQMIQRQPCLVYSKDHLDRTPFWWACRYGHLSIVELLLTPEVDPNCPDVSGRTPLSIAAEKGHFEIVKFLVPRANASAADVNGKTSLWWACGYGRLPIVELLLIADVDPNCPDVSGRTPLSIAAEKGHFEVVTFLVPRVNIYVADVNGKTPLWWACKYDRIFIVELLLALENIEPDTEDTTGVTPLSIALSSGHSDTASLLYPRADVNIDSRDHRGRTSLWKAAEGNVLSAIQFITQHGKPDIDHRDNDGCTPLSIAAQRGHIQAIRALQYRDINLADSDGRTPLWWATYNSMGDALVELLLDPAVDVNIQDNEGRTALSIAVQKWSLRITSLLRDRSDVNLADIAGRTPLWYAAESGSAILVGALLQNSEIDLDRQDDQGHTPLSIAEKNGHTNVVRILKKEQWVRRGDQQHGDLDVE